jgi:hypothetical protein
MSDAQHKIIEILLSVKDDVTKIDSKLSILETKMDIHATEEGTLRAKVSKIERQVNMAHGALALFALIGTIAGIVKALS